MADKHEKLLSELEFRMRQLMFLCDALREENQTLKHHLQQKDADIGNLSVKLEELNSKYGSLKFASSISIDKDTEGVEEAKRKLLKLVHDVDKCIALLKQ